MKTIRNIIVIIIMILGTMCIANAQNYGYKWSESDPADYWYLSPSFDVNKAFKLKDNSRTKIDHHGLDFDVELGARDNHVGVFLFYGQFAAMDYQNYGVGVDYYINLSRTIHLSAGLYYSTIIRYNNFTQSSYVSPRAITTVWLSKNVGLLAKLQYQGRPDLDKRIVEGAIGVTIKFDR